MEEQFKTFGLEMTATVEEVAKAEGIDVEFVIREGHPAEKILDFAEKQDAEYDCRRRVDMIVVGSQGKQMLNASCSEACPKKSSGTQRVPVLVVHGKRQ